MSTKTPSVRSETLELLGLKEKDFVVYLRLLELGSAPLRRIAAEAGLSRGTAYDALKRLKAAGLVGWVDATRHRYFTAEDPEQIRALVARRERGLQHARSHIDALLPDLRVMRGRSQHRPAVRYYEGARGTREILEDVLTTTAGVSDRTYRVYSSPGVRDLIATASPRYNALRKARGVHVRAIAIGEGGGTHGMDERRWLSHRSKAPIYIFIYGEKTAYVSIDERRELFGVIIDDAGIAETQRVIFDALWETLSSQESDS